MTVRRLRLAIDDARTVSGLLHVPAKPSGSALILAHGAGTDLTAPLLVAVAEGLAARGVTVLRFNFLYKELGRKAPDRFPLLALAYRAAIAAVRGQRPKRVFLGGKSMGGRVASMLAAEGTPSAGLVFLGYPLHPAGKPEKPRSLHLAAIAAPMLFLQGTRDALCDLALLRPVLAPLRGRATLHVVEGGDHAFDLLKSAGRAKESVHAELIHAIHEWIAVRANAPLAPAMPEPLLVSDTVQIPASAITVTTARASGPGGQNVNKVASKVDVRVDLAAIVGLDLASRERLAEQAANRLDGAGLLQVTSQKTRDQGRNLADAYEKIRVIVAKAMVAPVKRKPTKPSRGAVRRRLEDKKQTSERKKARARPAE